MAYNGVEYLMFVLRRETRFGFVKALSFKRSERIREAMLDMQSLLRGVWRFHGDEGREFMGAVELAEKNVLSFTPQPTPTIETRIVSSKKVLFDVFCIMQNAPVCPWPDAAEHANEVFNHSKRLVPGQNIEVEPIVLERRAFSGQAECDWLPRENQVRGHLGVVWRLQSSWNIPQ